MYGVLVCEFIGLKKSACDVIFEWVFLLLATYHSEVFCYHWHINYNMYAYNRDKWSMALRIINKTRIIR